MKDKQNEIYEINLNVANDSGNSNQKTIINGEYFIQPNVIRKITKKPELSTKSLEGVIKNLDNELLVKVLNPEPAMYYVGSKALKDDTSRVEEIRIGRGNKKSDNKIVFISALARIAAFAVKKAYKENKLNCTQIKATVDMGLALPINQYDKHQVEQYKDEFLGKKHIVAVILPEKDEVIVELNFVFVHTIAEGVDTIFYLENAEDEVFANTDKKITKDTFKNENKKILHLSIGEGTTEDPITYGEEFEIEKSGLPFGVGEAIDRVTEDFNIKFHKNYTRQTINDILIRRSGKFYAPVIELFEEYIEETSEKIIYEVTKKLENTSSEIEIMVVYGGGSILMREYLEPKLKELCDREYIQLLYLDKKYAIDAEVRGLYNFVTSDVFNFLKNQYLKTNSTK